MHSKARAVFPALRQGRAFVSGETVGFKESKPKSVQGEMAVRIGATDPGKTARLGQGPEFEMVTWCQSFWRCGRRSRASPVSPFKPQEIPSESWSPRQPASLAGELCVFARAAMANYRTLGGSGDGNALSHSPGGQKSEIRVSAGRVPPEAVRETLFRASRLASGGLPAIFGVPWLVGVAPRPLPSAFSWHSPCVRISVQVSSSYKGPSHIGGGPTEMTSF